jgi:SAM-dependent methyltransferase
MHALRRLLSRRFRPPRLPYPAVDEPSCAVCGSTRRETVGESVSFGMAYRTALCLDCGLVYLCPRPSAASFDEFYEELYPRMYGRTEVAAAGDDRGRSVFAFLRPERERGVLDIGCGDGALLLAFAEQLGATGVPLAGCDPGWRGDSAWPPAIPVARARIDEVTETLGSYSLFIAYDTVEHLLDPVDFLRTLHAAARDDARLFISTVCLDNWLAIPPGGWENYYLRLAHTYVFSRLTLAALLERGGWVVDRYAAAPKGDQWVLCSKLPAPHDPQPLSGHVEEVRQMIDSYRARVADQGDRQRRE